MKNVLAEELSIVWVKHSVVKFVQMYDYIVVNERALVMVEN